MTEKNILKVIKLENFGHSSPAQWQVVALNSDGEEIDIYIKYRSRAFSMNLNDDNMYKFWGTNKDIQENVMKMFKKDLIFFRFLDINDGSTMNDQEMFKITEEFLDFSKFK